MYDEQAVSIIMAVAGVVSAAEAEDLSRGMADHKRGYESRRAEFVKRCGRQGVIDKTEACQLVEEMTLQGKPPLSKAYALGFGMVTHMAAATAMRFPKEWKLVGRSRNDLFEHKLLREC